MTTIHVTLMITHPDDGGRTFDDYLPASDAAELIDMVVGAPARSRWRQVRHAARPACGTRPAQAHCPGRRRLCRHADHLDDPANAGGNHR